MCCEITSKRAVPPEVLFHRWLSENSPRRPDLPREHPDSRIYRGKKNLDDVEQEDLRSLLVVIQDAFNEGLRNEHRNVPHHVRHPPLHFDYIDSDFPNAVAFPHERYSFIGVSMAMIYLLGDICHKLSQSEAVVHLLGLEPTAEEAGRIYAMLFQNLLGFVIAHEYTHHVHGHVAQRVADPIALNEVADDGDNGSLESQVCEVDADGYAAYHVLSNLINSEYRTLAVATLKCNDKRTEIQDRLLFACFVIAVGAFLFTRPPLKTDERDIYRQSHPPQAARMNAVMHHAIGWCKQNRPDLEVWMTTERFQELMHAVAVATWGMNGGATWDAQTALLKSEAGAQYFKRLDELLKAHVASL